jgi:N-acetylglucosaminyl-diphospho-decaprenol L-rhamnosyltransferase
MPQPAEQHDGPHDFEVVLVTYQSRALAQALLARLPAGVPVAIVDNAQGVDGVPELAASRPNTRYLDGPGQGFAKAANLGARTSSAPYLVFVNPDSAPTADQLEALVADLQDDPGLAAVGATTVLPSGRVELGVGGWEPTVLRSFVHAVGAHAVFPTAGLYARPVPNRPLALDWLSGACLAVPREEFLALGGFDDSYFVYNEDMAYGRRVRQAGRRLRLRTDVLVPHLGGGSGEAKPRMFQMRGASMVGYVSAHNTRPTVLGIKFALTAGTALRWLECRLRGRPELARSHAAYIKGLWSGPPDMS